MQVRLWVSGGLAIIGGALMVESGYVSHGLLYLALGFAGSEVPAYLGGFSGDLVLLGLSVLEFIIALGGITVALGGLVLLTGHRTTGRMLILLGGGAGFLGVAIAFGLAAFRLGPSSATSLATYWVGLILAVVARRLAKGINAK